MPSSLEVSACSEQGMVASEHTFDKIGLDELSASAINEKWFQWDRVTGSSFRRAYGCHR